MLTITIFSIINVAEASHYSYLSFGNQGGVHVNRIMLGGGGNLHIF